MLSALNATKARIAKLDALLKRHEEGVDQPGAPVAPLPVPLH